MLYHLKPIASRGGQMTRKRRQYFMGRSALGSSLNAAIPNAVVLLTIWTRIPGRRLFVCQ